MSDEADAAVFNFKPGEIVEVMDTQSELGGLRGLGAKRAEVVRQLNKNVVRVKRRSDDHEMNVLVEDCKRIDAITAIGDLDGD